MTNKLAFLVFVLGFCLTACAIPIRSTNILAPATVASVTQIPGLANVPNGKSAIVFIRNHRMFAASGTTVETSFMGEMLRPLKSKDYLVVYAPRGIYRYVVSSRKGAFVGGGISSSTSHLVEVQEPGQPIYVEVVYGEPPVRRNETEAFELISGLSLVGLFNAPTVSPAMAAALIGDSSVMPTGGGAEISALDVVTQAAETRNAQLTAREQQRQERLAAATQQRQIAINQQRTQLQQAEMEMMRQSEIDRERQDQRELERRETEQAGPGRNDANTRQQQEQNSRQAQQAQRERLAKKENDEKRQREEARRKETENFSSANCVRVSAISNYPDFLVRIFNSCDRSINWAACIFIDGRAARDYPTGTTAPGSTSDIRSWNQDGRRTGWNVNHCGGPYCNAPSPSSC